MPIYGWTAAPTPGAPHAPYVTAWVNVSDPVNPPPTPVSISFMVDTGADRTVLSLRKARQLIGVSRWASICHRRQLQPLAGIGGLGHYWEVPMRLWFVESLARTPIMV